jgi:hypothetical protein
MKWTLGLLLLGAVGCAGSQTRMVACPDNGCPETYASSSSPQGLPAPHETRATRMEPILTAPPITPLPDNAPPPPEPPVPSP